MTELLWPDRQVVARVFHEVRSDHVSDEKARSIVHQVSEALAADPRLATLYVYSVRDHAGRLHVCLGEYVPSSGLEAYRIDVAGIRRAIINDEAEQGDIAERLPDDGTDI